MSILACENPMDLHGGTHPLTKTVSEALADCGQRFLADELIDVGEILKESGMEPADIHQAFLVFCKKKEIEVTFNYKDVYNHFRTKPGEKILDTTNVIAHLQDMKSKDPSFHSNYSHDEETAKLDKLFFTMAGSKELSDQFSTDSL